MIVLGIDPGSRRCGYGIVERVGPRLLARDSGVLEPDDLPVPERLGQLLEGLGAVIGRSRADAVSVETAFFGLSARSALILGQARGVVLAAAARAGLPIFEYAPAEVKRAFTGNGRAEKAQMVRVARELLGVEARYADEADAVAVAVCHLAHLRSLPQRARTGSAATRPALTPAVRRFGAAR